MYWWNNGVALAWFQRLCHSAATIELARGFVRRSDRNTSQPNVSTAASTIIEPIA